MVELAEIRRFILSGLPAHSHRLSQKNIKCGKSSSSPFLIHCPPTKANRIQYAYGKALNQTVSVVRRAWNRQRYQPRHKPQCVHLPPTACPPGPFQGCAELDSARLTNGDKLLQQGQLPFRREVKKFSRVTLPPRLSSFREKALGR